eukprot:359642-Chlamydomonas_euryale.AAC.4
MSGPRAHILTCCTFPPSYPAAPHAAACAWQRSSRQQCPPPTVSQRRVEIVGSSPARSERLTRPAHGRPGAGRKCEKGGSGVCMCVGGRMAWIRPLRQSHCFVKRVRPLEPSSEGS